MKKNVLRFFVGLIVAYGVFFLPVFSAKAHWCSNIYKTYARLVVKPERAQINVALGQSGSLKIRVRNNFPYTLRYLRLRTNSPSGLTIGVTPSSDTGFSPVRPGEEVTFSLQISRQSDSTDNEVTSLNLQLATAVMSSAFNGDWLNWTDQNSDDDWVIGDANLDPQVVRDRMWESQSVCLNSAKLTDLSDVGCGNCENQGMEGSASFDGLMDLWQYAQNDSTFDCGNCQSQQVHMRAGQALAIRLRFDSFQTPNRATVMARMKEVLQNSQGELVKGLAAFYAAYGYKNGDDLQADLENLANNGSLPGAAKMAKAGLLIMGQANFLSDVQACVNNGSENLAVRAACAAALGMLGADYDNVMKSTLVTSAFIGNGTDAQMAWNKLVPNYLLQLTALDRRGGPQGGGSVSFYDEEVVIDDVPPLAPQNFQVRIR